MSSPPVPHPDAPPPGTALPPHYAGCFACGELEGGLRIRAAAGAELTVTATYRVQTHHQGAPGIAHGGLISAAFDEAFGMLQVHVREPAVTASLQTEFRRPVPVDSVLHLECRLDAREGRKLMVSGVARLDAVDGPVAATATAVFVVVPWEHFVTHGRAQDAAAHAERRHARAVSP